VKVIGAGFGRTGTLSLKVALEELGAGPCLHALQSLTAAGSPHGASHWERLANGERIDWREAFDGWGSTVDWLGARFYPEMLDAWPEAKVILSVRDPERWYESCHESLHPTHRLAGAVQSTGPAPAVLQAVDRAIWQDVFDGRFSEREHALEVFERHSREVSSRIPADRLLVYDIREGWEPLCEFLEVPIPVTPFPHLNDRSSFWTRFGIESMSDTNAASSLPALPPDMPAHTHVAESRLGCTHVRISGLALAHPQTSFTQHEVLHLLGLADDEFAQRIFSRCGVYRRRLDLTPELLRNTLQGRTVEVEDQLMGYAVQAVEQLGVDPTDIGTVVTGTLYSLGGPTLAHRLIERFEMDPSTDKYHVVGVGCASAVPLVRLATQSLREHPGKKALVVAAESMSGLLMGAREQDTRSKTVGSSIFADGCGAMLLDADDAASGPTILASKVHQIADSLDAVSMKLAPHDSYLHLVKELPDVAGAHVGGLVDDFLKDNGLRRQMIHHWLLHPGGRRIIECAQRALSLPDEEVQVSFDVLANHGNVGTPSIFYVMHETIERRNPGAGERGLMVTIGPGVTVGLMLLRW
jgi:predicted naringenin-chalcone synthase